MWVANQVSNTVTKVLAKDGSIQGTFIVGQKPVGVAFDGNNIWVTNQGSNSVTALVGLDCHCG
jgi:DNA-binding beta-propeller fold protein YncE